MIEVNHLSKFYGKHHAVDDVSFSAQKGQIIGLLGPNGAGKSSIMNMMTGYISASSGEVRIGEYEIFKDPMKAKKQIGYLPEMPPLYEDMTVQEYLLYVCELKKVGARKERKKIIDEICEKVRIAEVKSRLIRNLSKGYKQRVGLAQALIGNPPVLILDEPTVGLDPKQIIEIRSLIKELQQEHTIIFSSHILSEVSEICDDIVIINKGKLVASGDTQTLTRENAAGNKINLTVLGDEKKVESLLQRISYLDQFTIEKTAEDKRALALTLIAKGKEDIRERLFYLFAEKKIPIIQMTMDSSSLEDVFIELTEAPVDESGKAQDESQSGTSQAKRTEKEKDRETEAGKVEEDVKEEAEDVSDL